MGKYLINKIFLVITAMLVGLVIYGFVIVLNKIGIQREWIFFIWGCITYTAVMIYLSIAIMGFKKYLKKIVLLLLFVFFVCFPISVGFIIFYFNFLSLPKNLMPYLLISIILAPTSVICFEYCVKLLQRGRKGIWDQS